MRMEDAPEPTCPSCEGHPALVYEGSVGPLSLGAGQIYHHYFRCAMCGRHYRAGKTGEAMPTPPNQEAKPYRKKCYNCGEPMVVRQIAREDVSSGPRKLGGVY